MNEKFLNLLIKWNGGIERGAQNRLSKQLNITRGIIHLWVSGAQIPGEANLHKMAELFGVPISTLYKVFNRKPRIIGPGLELVPQVSVSFSALAHAGEVIFIDDSAAARAEKGDNMKLHIKIADDGFAPKFNKGDIVVIDTRAEAKSDGVCLAREKKNKQYMLCENKGYSFYNGVKNEKKADVVVIGWAVEVISIKKL